MSAQLSFYQPVASPTTFPLENRHRMMIFGLQGEPYRDQLLKAMDWILRLESLDSEAAALLFQLILNGTSFEQAAATFRCLDGSYTIDSWIEHALRARVEDLRFVFTRAIESVYWDAPIATIDTDRFEITYVHRKDSRVWVEAGNEVIVPATPRTRRLKAAGRVYLQALQPTKPWRDRSKRD